ncbi:hypothetical protein J1N35_016563, partial [Gossypium stocksii]
MIKLVGTSLTLLFERQTTISEGKWNPIRLSRDGPDISHLFFTDDLVIFSKADSKHCRVLKDILDRFYALSGLKINARKTNIFFSKGVDEGSVDTISIMFGFQPVHNLGHYLGVPLLHQRVTSGTLQLVVEKVRGKLQSWEVKKLSLAGCITLAQSVLLSIPSYFMQTMMIPKKIRVEIEKIVRQFIWGSFERKRKMALVGQDSICQPKTCGSLGLRNLRDQNISFLMKLGFKLVSDKDSFWVWVSDEVIQAIKSIPPSHPSEGPDRISWNHTSSGVFSVKTTYKAVKGEDWNLGESLVMLKDLGEVSWMILRAPFAVPTQKRFCTSYIIVWQPRMVGLRLIQVIFNAKLWGILEGLKLIQCWGYDHVTIHSDSLKVVKGILGNSSSASNFALIRRIHNILSQEHQR